MGSNANTMIPFTHESVEVAKKKTISVVLYKILQHFTNPKVMDKNIYYLPIFTAMKYKEP